MKQVIKILLLFTLLMTAALLLINMRFEKSEVKGRDIVYYNDCLLSMYDDYKNGITEREIELKYGCNIIFTKELIDSELTKYYVSGALVLDFSPDGNYLGKVVWNDTGVDLKNIKETSKNLVILFWAVILIIGYLMIFLIWYTLIRPVNELNRFSVEISKGNLEVPLPIHKNNLFGGFTESFDTMREELKAARLREIEAGIAKKEMVAALSHDIKTPIATIQATCEVLDMKYRRCLGRYEEGLETACESGEKKPIREIEDTLEKLNSISAKAETVNSIMNNLVHATMDDLNRIEINPVETDSRIVENYFINLKNSGSDTAIVLDNHIPECLIYADTLRMEQVIDNIIGNSRKYAGTDIHVSFSTVETGYIRIKIKDSGPGVREDELPLITEKYYRGSSAGNKSGYGLGMYLVKMYMEKQGGGIEYYNDNGFVVEVIIKKV